MPGNVVDLEQRARLPRGLLRPGPGRGAGVAAALATRADRPARVPVPAGASWYSRHRTTESPMSYSGGGTTEHSGMASAQRGWNRQAGGGAAMSGGAPAMPVSGILGPRTEGNASSRARAYGCRGVPNSEEVEPSSATCPAYITSTRSEKLPHQRDVVGDEDRREPEPVLQLLDLPHQ